MFILISNLQAAQIILTNMYIVELLKTIAKALKTTPEALYKAITSGGQGSTGKASRPLSELPRVTQASVDPSVVKKTAEAAASVQYNTSHAVFHVSAKNIEKLHNIDNPPTALDSMSSADRINIFLAATLVLVTAVGVGFEIYKTWSENKHQKTPVPELVPEQKIDPIILEQLKRIKNVLISDIEHLPQLPRVTAEAAAVTDSEGLFKHEYACTIDDSLSQERYLYNRARFSLESQSSTVHRMVLVIEDYNRVYKGHAPPVDLEKCFFKNPDISYLISTTKLEKAYNQVGENISKFNLAEQRALLMDLELEKELSEYNDESLKKTVRENLSSQGHLSPVLRQQMTNQFRELSEQDKHFLELELGQNVKVAQVELDKNRSIFTRMSNLEKKMYIILDEQDGGHWARVPSRATRCLQTLKLPPEQGFK